MTVGSALEIYTTFFGWAFYGTLWEVVVGTGIVYIPFIAAVYQSWVEPTVSSQRSQPTAIASLKQMQARLYPMFFVVMFAGIPLIQLDVDQLNYPTVICATEDTEQVEGRATGTTYDSMDDFVAVDGEVNVPLVWYIWMSITNGSSRSLIKGMACFEDIDGLDYKLRNLTIEDEPLRQEFTRFANECFVPVKSKFTEAMKDGQFAEYTQEEFTEGLVANDWDETDPYYVGSRFYRETEGFYRPCVDPDICGLHRFRAKSPVEGFGYDPARDADYTPEEIIDGVGRPYCDEWWVNAAGGLRSRLVAAAQDIEPTLVDSIKEQTMRAVVWAADVLGLDAAARLNEDDVDDLLVKRIISSETVDFTGIDGLVETSTNIHSDDLTAIGAGGVGLLGLGKAAVSLPALKAAGIAAAPMALATAKDVMGFYTSIYVAKKAAPMVQAVLFMLIYMVLPMYLIATGFSFGGIFTMLLTFFVLRFFTVLWAAGSVLDAQLYVAMFPDASVVGSILSLNINRFILDIVLSVFFLVGPVIVLGIVAMSGTKMAFAGGDGFMNPVRNLGTSPSKGKLGGGGGKKK